MPGLKSNTDTTSHDRVMTEALEQFCGFPEQSYEQFLSTFLYLTTGDVTSGRLPALRGENSTSVGEMNRRVRESPDTVENAMDERCFQTRGQQNHHSLAAHLEELVLDGSVTAGRLGKEETLPSDQPVKFDNYLDDMVLEEEPLHAGEDVRTLPGEVVEDLPLYTPSFCHHTLLELSSTATGHRTHTPQSTAECQNETEEVVPFRLDEMFDYDNVVLSQKPPIHPSTSEPS